MADRLTPERLAEIESGHVSVLDSIPELLAEIRPLLGGVEQDGVIAAVKALTAERAALSARVAELEEAARWRTVAEWVPIDDVIEFQVASGRRLGFGPLPGEEYWETDDSLHAFVTTDILGWRPLGPGPEVK